MLRESSGKGTPAPAEMGNMVQTKVRTGSRNDLLIIEAVPTEYIAYCPALECRGKYSIVGVPANIETATPVSERWYPGDFRGRGRQTLGQCAACGRTYSVRKGRT